MNEEPRSVVTLEIAERMLAEIASVDDALQLINFAEQARVYARQSKLGTSAINHATVIKVRAERKLADIVDEGQKRGEIAVAGPGADVRDPNISGLDDLGIDRFRLAEARLLRDAYTDDDLVAREDDASARDEVISRQRLLVEARAENARNGEIAKKRVARLFPVYEALEALAGMETPAAEWAASVPAYSAHRVSDHLDAALDWLTELKGVWRVT